MLLTLALACAPHPAPPVAAAEAQAAPAATEVAPSEATISPPVTLDQLRAAFPVGTKIRLGITMKDKPPVEQRWTWTAVDPDGCTIASTLHDADGNLLADEGAARSTWAELMGHAVFPAARTTREDSRVEVPAGTFDTWHYTVTDTVDGAPVVKRFHFAKTLPGPPLLYTLESGGVEVFRMTMIERTRP